MFLNLNYLIVCFILSEVLFKIHHFLVSILMHLIFNVVYAYDLACNEMNIHALGAHTPKSFSDDVLYCKYLQFSVYYDVLTS